MIEIVVKPPQKRTLFLMKAEGGIERRFAKIPYVNFFINIVKLKGMYRFTDFKVALSETGDEDRKYYIPLFGNSFYNGMVCMPDWFYEKKHKTKKELVNFIISTYWNTPFAENENDWNFLDVDDSENYLGEEISLSSLMRML